MLKFDTETKIMSIIAKDTGSFILTLDNYILDYQISSLLL